MEQKSLACPLMHASQSAVAPWMRQARLATWWLGIEALSWPDYDLEEGIVRRARYLADHGVNVVVVFGLHFRWDFVPFFSRIAQLIRRIAQECHKHDVRLCDHYSDTLIHRPHDEADRWFIREQLNHHVPLYPDPDQDFHYAGSDRNSWRAMTYHPPWHGTITCRLRWPAPMTTVRVYAPDGDEDRSAEATCHEGLSTLRIDVRPAIRYAIARIETTASDEAPAPHK